MKTCIKCGLEKAVTEFYPRQGDCKLCYKARVRAYRLANIERIRQYDRDRAASRTEQNAKVGKAWREAHPDRYRANTAVNNAVRDGRLFKWPACAVPDCDCTRVVAHHADYDRPLDVVWLCQPHHKQAHALLTNHKE